jgi:hypothetical protein
MVLDELVPPDGQIQRPLLTMHGTGDLYVDPPSAR